MDTDGTKCHVNNSKTPAGMMKVLTTLGPQHVWSVSVIRTLVTIVEVDCKADTILKAVATKGPQMTHEAVQSAISLLNQRKDAGTDEDVVAANTPILTNTTSSWWGGASKKRKL